jgi:dTDP-4-dehydrorhamnose reductase
LAEPHLGRRPHLSAIPTAQYPTPAKRPANSRLAMDKIAQAHGIYAPDWAERLANVVPLAISGG